MRTSHPVSPSGAPSASSGAYAPTPAGVASGRYSYSSLKMGLRGRLNELAYLLRASWAPATESVERTLRTVRSTKKRVQELTGIKLEKQTMLDIGPGQQLRHLRCFAVDNDAIGIDTDVIPQGLDVRGYLEMLRRNPALRVGKTIARKALGKDARFDKELKKALGVQSLPRPKVLAMSATAMTFPDQSFDCVCSYSVFEHIDNPKAALSEVKRVLKKGGVAYISIHLYTSHSGSHDPTIAAQGGPTEPLWPHLRPRFAATVQPSTYLNRLSLAEWRQVFEEVMPNVTFIPERQDDEIGDGLKKLREQGELSQYTDEELMTVNLVCVWQKP